MSGRNWRKLCELHAKYDLKDTPLIWLTRNRVEAVKCIEPTNITRLSMEIVDFIQDTGKGMILFEGIEYLISQNSYPIILRFIQLLNDKIMLGNSGMLIPLNPLILQESELYMLERDMKTLPWWSGFKLQAVLSIHLQYSLVVGRRRHNLFYKVKNGDIISERSDFFKCII